MMRVTDLTPRPAQAKQLPVEIWLETVQYLTPTDFLSFEQTCTDFWDLRHASVSMAHVLRQCPLTPANDTEASTAPGAQTAWQTVQQRANLHHRLQRGPIQIDEGRGTALSGWELSPGNRHFMYEARKVPQHAVHIVHLDGGHRPVTKLAVTSRPWILDFLAAGQSLLVWCKENGPIELLDLRLDPPVLRLIAPKSNFLYRGYISNTCGSQFTFSCSDKTFRTYVRDQNEIFKEDKVVLFGADVDIQHMTADQRGVIALSENGHNLHLYGRRSDGTYSVTDIDADCCTEVRMSRRDRFFYLMPGCRGFVGNNFYALNLDNEQPLCSIGINDDSDVYYNSDESQAAVTHDNTFDLFTWPTLTQILHNAVSATHAPEWLSQILARKKHASLRLNYQFRHDPPGVALFLAER
jgi:hypothetical protein